MRVRRFELRILAGILAVGWALFAGLVLVLYRPGGPIDIAVVAVAFVPVAIAFSAVAWPPTARGVRAFGAIAWLGVAVALVLLPSIGGLLAQLEAGGTQTLLPSLEAAYPWLLALAGTSLFAGLGIARARLGDASLRRRRLALGVGIGAALTVATATAFAAVAIGNDVALRDRPAFASRFGPTDPTLPLPDCNASLAVPATARIDESLGGDVDGRTLGSVDLDGIRVEADARVEGTVATAITLGQVGAARIGSRAWRLAGRDGWSTTDPVDVAADVALDRGTLETALAPGNRTTFEARGIEFVEGARARHCRIAVDGPTFRDAFPAVRWLIGDADVHRWRGELDFWVFADGAVGRVGGSVNGDAGRLPTAGIQGTIHVTMSIVDRGRALSVLAPGS